MNYLSQINAFFFRASDNDRLSSSARMLYLSLLQFNNLSGWRETFRVSYLELMDLSGIRSKDTYYSALRDLVEEGLVSYTPGSNRYESASFSLKRLYEDQDRGQLSVSYPDPSRSLDRSNKDKNPDRLPLDSDTKDSTRNTPKLYKHKKEKQYKRPPAEILTLTLASGKVKEIPLTGNSTEKYRALFTRYFQEETILDLWEDWERLRAEKGKKHTITDRARELEIANLDRLSGGDFDKAIRIIERSIKGSGQPWDGLFPLKEEVSQVRAVDRSSKFDKARNSDPFNI